MNKTGITWLTKTKQQKQDDINKHFFDSKIRILENKIKNIKTEIIDCEEKIERFIPLCIQEEIVDAKNSSKKIKEKIAFTQREIGKIKSRRRRRQDRTKTKLRKAFEEIERDLLTEIEMISIIKFGE